MGQRPSCCGGRDRRRRRWAPRGFSCCGTRWEEVDVDEEYGEAAHGIELPHRGMVPVAIGGYEPTDVPEYGPVTAAATIALARLAEAKAQGVQHVRIPFNDIMPEGQWGEIQQFDDFIAIVRTEGEAAVVLDHERNQFILDTRAEDQDRIRRARTGRREVGRRVR